MKNFEDYKSNGRVNNRKIVEPNKIKTEIINEIDKVKDENKSIGIILDTIFNVIGASMHEIWLCKNFEVEDNYYRTYRNVCRCKERAIMEVLSFIYKYNLAEELNLKLLLDTHDSKVEEKYDLIVMIGYKKLRMYVRVNYSNMSKWIQLPKEIEECKYELKNTVKYDGNKLNKQQYFDQPLKEKLQHVDDLVGELLKIRNNK